MDPAFFKCQQKKMRSGKIIPLFAAAVFFCAVYSIVDFSDLQYMQSVSFSIMLPAFCRLPRRMRFSFMAKIFLYKVQSLRAVSGPVRLRQFSGARRKAMPALRSGGRLFPALSAPRADLFGESRYPALRKTHEKMFDNGAAAM